MNHRDRQIQKQFKQRFYHYTAADSANGTNSGSKKEIKNGINIYFLPVITR